MEERDRKVPLLEMKRFVKSASSGHFCQSKYLMKSNRYTTKTFELVQNFVFSQLSNFVLVCKFSP